MDTADPMKLDLQVVRQSKVKDLNPDDFKTEQVFVPSKDGTKVPMFIVSHKDFVRDGKVPALLYGYGGFSISLSPFFKVSNMCFVRSFGARAIILRPLRSVTPARQLSALLRHAAQQVDSWRPTAPLPQAASLPSRTCAAGTNTARRGTRPGRFRTSRTSLMTSKPAGSISLTRASRVRRSWRSRAAATGACSSGRA